MALSVGTGEKPCALRHGVPFATRDLPVSIKEVIRFYNAVDLVNQLDKEKQQGKAGNLLKQLTTMDAEAGHGVGL